ncbi:MAG TPA: tetratricopeptide repeat protein [Terriglobales bacterium]|nr:tetratricopeptide repeat protein [Terriglobales bacterium]
MHAREQQASNRRLDSWKEIAAFFGRDERTVKRWEKERALPVHRVPGGVRSGVFAYTDELSQWLKDPAAEEGESSFASDVDAAVREKSSADVIGEAGPSMPKPVPVPTAPPGSSKFSIARILGLLLAVLLGFVILRHQIPRPPTSASATSNVPLDHRPNPDAEELYLKGRYFWNKRTPEDLNKALDLFTQAIVRDPSYAPAYVGLADSYNLMREYSVMPPNEAYPRALAAAKKAVELDDKSAEAHNSLAFVTFYWTWDAATAEQEFKRAIALNPDYVAAHHWYATFLMTRRRYPEAVAEIETARKLDPSSTPIVADKGLIIYWAGQREKGTALLTQIEAREPDFLSPHLYLSEIYLNGKDYPNYLAESKKVAVLRHDSTALAIVNAAEKGFATGGVQAMWESMLPVQKKFYQQGSLSPYPLAQTYAQLGQNQEALSYLRDAYEKRDAAMLFMNTDRSFDGLHDDLSFRELLARSNQPRLN